MLLNIAKNLFKKSFFLDRLSVVLVSSYVTDLRNLTDSVINGWRADFQTQGDKKLL